MRHEGPYPVCWVFLQTENYFGMTATDNDNPQRTDVEDDGIEQEAEGAQSCPPDHASCPRSTCCGIGADAVCCPGGETCCPAGTECGGIIGSMACHSKAEEVEEPEPLIEVQGIT